MIFFRPIELDTDYPTLEGWWRGHNSMAVPKVILPRGWIAHAASVEIAASFLYVVEGKIAMIEWTTTNPRCAMSRDLIAAVKGLYAHLEEVAREENCICILSMVAPRSSEERIMTRMGFTTSTDDMGHRLFAKPLIGAPVQCPL